MTSAARKFFGCSHIAVVGLGVMLGLRGSLEMKHQGTPPPSQADSTSSLSKPEPDAGDFSVVSKKFSTEDYAAAWNSLKGRFLPKQERLHIAKALLQEWSVIDLEAAVQAVFAETTDEGPGQIGRVRVPSLLDLCGPGIQADPIAAWNLVRSRVFGWDTPRFRNAWIDCMTVANPVSIFPILGEIPKRERLFTLSSLAESACNAKDPATRAAVWAQFSGLPETLADQEVITLVAETIRYHTPPAELAAQLLGETTPTGRKIRISAVSLSLFEVEDDDEFSKPLLQLPTAIRGEVAAASLMYAERDETRALALAHIALDSGNLDALQVAAAEPTFARFAKEISQPLALVDWALRLPEDPRTLEIFRQSIEGAAHGEFEAVRTKLETLPPGWHREQGLSVLSKLGKQRKTDDE